MADFTLSLAGNIDGAEARAAFEEIVNSLAGAIDLSGEIIVDGVTYSVADVPELEETDEAEEPAAEEPAETEGAES